MLTTTIMMTILAVTVDRKSKNNTKLRKPKHKIKPKIMIVIIALIIVKIIILLKNLSSFLGTAL